jgi:beta-lactamase class A
LSSVVQGERLREAWDAELAGAAGTFSLALLGPSGAVASRDADVPHYAASTIKLAVLAVLLRERTAGRPDAFGLVDVHAEFAGVTGGPFPLRQSDDQDDDTWARLGRTADLLWLAERMIVVSGNLATDLVVERLGIGSVQRFLADARLSGPLGFTRLIGDAAAEAAGSTNTVTAAGLASLMTGIADHTLLGAADSERALGFLAAQQHRRMIPAGLPESTWSASKGGWVPGVQHDVALVRPESAPSYTLAVCTTSPLSEPDAERLIARLSTITWEHWIRWHG